MTTNLKITIDESNNVLKVANAALRFMPQDASGQRTGGGNSNGQRRRQSSSNANTGTDASTQSRNGNNVQFEPPTAPELDDQTRIDRVLGQDAHRQRTSRRVGLTDA